MLNAITAEVESVVGGSADLTGSTGSAIAGRIVGHPDFEGQDVGYDGRQIHYGIREHAMGAVTNGMLLHGGLDLFRRRSSYSATTCDPRFDWLPSAIFPTSLSSPMTVFSLVKTVRRTSRLSITGHCAAFRIPSTSDPLTGSRLRWLGIGLSAEDADQLGLTRQGLPAIERDPGFDIGDVARGGYVVSEQADAAVTLVGTGSELHVCVDAARALNASGIAARVVSMPSVDLFDTQPSAYVESVLPAGIPVVTVEAGITGPWKPIQGAPDSTSVSTVWSLHRPVSGESSG